MSFRLKASKSTFGLTQVSVYLIYTVIGAKIEWKKISGRFAELKANRLKASMLKNLYKILGKKIFF